MDAALVEFNANCSLFACVSPDGLLKVWDVVTGGVRAQRAADLSDQISTLAWCPLPDETHGKRKKKRKSLNPGQVNLLALGTVSGKVIIFDASSEEQTVLQGSHGGRTHSIAWQSAEKLFSGSADKHIFDWNLGDKTMSSKWVADKRGVSALALAGVSEEENNLLLSAGSQIVLWNSDTREQLKSFMGHERAVSNLIYHPGVCVSCVRGDTDDSLINVWSIDSDGKKPAVSFESTTSTVALDSLVLSDEPKLLRVLSVSPSARVAVFQQELGKRVKKPVAASGSITVTTSDGSSVPVLSARFDTASPRSRVVIARGLAALPQFDTVEYVGTDEDLKDVSITRQAPENLLLSGNGAIAAEKTTVGAGAAVILGIAETGPKGKKKTDAEPTLEEQIRKMGVSAPAAALPPSRKVAKATSLAQMLVQALHSSDNALLEECLNISSETVVRSSLVRLPTQYVVQLLTAIVGKFESTPNRGIQLLVWARTLLVVHSSFLMSIPDLSATIGSLYGLIEARVAVFPRLLKLTGRLELMLSQITKVTGSGVTEDDLQQPVNVYREDAMDEEAEDEVEEVDEDAIAFGSSDEASDDGSGEEAEDGAGSDAGGSENDSDAMNED